MSALRSENPLPGWGKQLKSQILQAKRNTCSDPEKQSKWSNVGKNNTPGSNKNKLDWKTSWKSHVLLPLSVFLGILSLILVVALTGVTVRSCSLLPEFSHVCPDTWPGFQGKCYYFSESEGNWTMSQERCRALGASLAIISTEGELNFTLRHKGEANYWIGLEKRDNGWRWINGTAFKHRFEARGRGLCGYLNEGRISSSLCHTEKNWICSRLDNYILWKKGLGDPKLRSFTPDLQPHKRTSPQYSY